MTLASTRIVVQGETPYAHERDAIQFAIDTIPNGDPFHLWALLELLDASTGRLFEIDLLVLGYSALYLIEVKSGPGRYDGDHQDWYRTDPSDPRPRYLENPYRLTNHKAKILGSRLRTKLKGEHLPWIEPLVFLSAKDLELRFANHGDLGVVTRNNFLRAVQHHEIPGRMAGPARTRISAPAAREIAQALHSLGIRPRQGKLTAGAYNLGAVIEDGEGYQDRLATHRQNPSMTCRARTYLVPQQTSVERRKQLLRAADREQMLLWDVRDHANVLRMAGYETDAPLGPTVLFDSFENGVPLPAFLRQNADLEFFDRVAIIEQVSRALAFCHRKQIVHGAVSPESVLVRRHPETKAIETRLFNFQLGGSTQIDATTHWSALGSERWALYQAPELREGASARTVQSDVFSLGAVAYYVFTGQPPGETVVEVSRKLAANRCLDPRAAINGIQEHVADFIAFATKVSPIERADDVEGWIELFLEGITRPAPPAAAPERDPLEARAEDTLGDAFVVEGVLGQGATSRVLQVRRVTDDRSYALKVPLDPEHEPRIAEEGETIERLRHARIVQCIDRSLVIGGRKCLLLSVAGSDTLHRVLTREGSISLDLAARYGEDLLSALEHLEEHQVLHRDIKPANVGVGSANKTASHLTIFDFSLARAGATDLHVGTAAYRDPFLAVRGSWDYAAERWSAAITLHEMLTGSRPSFEGTAIDREAKLVLAAERFDAAVRDGLVAFFERALAREAESRFASAEEMRRAWLRALETPVSVRGREEDPDSEPPESPGLTDAMIRAIAPDALIETLPLSARARNALDRAGLVRAGELLALADNRLSAVRGIGSLVAREILDLRRRWQALAALAPVDATPYFPGYRGDDLPLVRIELDDAVRIALRDAGITSLAEVAAIPRDQLLAIAKRHGFDDGSLRGLLDAENRRASQRERPSTVEAWIDALLPPKRRSSKHARALYGLEGHFAGQLDVRVKDLATHEEITTAAIYIALGKSREAWVAHSAIGELAREVHGVVDAASGAIPLAEAAAMLLARIPHDRAVADETRTIAAAALIRVIVEVEKEGEGRILQLSRAGSDKLWVFASSEHAQAIRTLANVADELAERDVPAGQGETTRVLGDAAAGTPLADVPIARLAELAAEASTKAARSSRLELYRRGLSRERALALSASLLKSDITPEEVIRRVALRYPEAEPLPPRPALDALLMSHGLTWSEADGRYQRPGESSKTSLHTMLSSGQRLPTALPTQPLAMDGDAVTARQFDDRLRNAIERRQLRVLGVRADEAEAAARELAARLDVAPVLFDKLLVEAIKEQMKRGNIRNDDLVHTADREGTTGRNWANFMRLVEAAGTSVADRILPPKEPLLLVQVGLLARYALTAFRTRLLEASKQADAAAILVLVPSHDSGGMPRLHRPGGTPAEPVLPGLLSSQALWVPHAWLRNRHNSAA